MGGRPGHTAEGSRCIAAVDALVQASGKAGGRRRIFWGRRGSQGPSLSLKETFDWTRSSHTAVSLAYGVVRQVEAAIRRSKTPWKYVTCEGQSLPTALDMFCGERHHGSSQPTTEAHQTSR